MTTPTYHVTLSQQDLADFLDDNGDWMEQYRAELQRRLSQHGQAEVEISRNALLDKVTVHSDNPDDLECIREEEEGVELANHIKGTMGDFDWLKQ